MLSHDITWHNPDYTTTLATLTNLEANYPEYNRRALEAEQNLKKLQTWAEQIRENVLSHIPSDYIFNTRFCESVDSHLRQVQHSAEISLSEAQTACSGLVESITSYKERLRRYPSRYDGTHKTSKREVADALHGLPHLKPKSVSTGYNRRGPFIQWTLTGILLQPDANPYDWLEGFNGCFPSIPLPDVVATVYPESGSVHLSPLPGQRQQAPFRWGSQPTVHPHILDQDEPCLGDFSGPVREAINDQEWVSLHTYLRIFLSRAVDTDSAGTHWKDPFTRLLYSMGANFDHTLATRFDQTEGGHVHYTIRETEPGSFELRTSRPSGTVIAATPLELRGNTFQEVASI